MNKVKGVILILLGIACITAAGYLVWQNAVEDRQAGETSAAVVETLSEVIAEKTARHEKAAETNDTAVRDVPDYIVNPDIEMPSVTIDGERYIGILTIHALDKALPVMGSWNYPRLRKAPCRYAGSIYEGNMVICAHNYGRHFGEIDDLPIGSQVDFTDAEGNVFRFKVGDIVTLKPRDSKLMKSGEWPLTLFTCTIGGATRVTVRCGWMDEDHP